MSKLSTCFLVLTIFLLSACDEKVKTGKDLLPRSVGLAGEVVVVMDDVHWNGSPGKAFQDYFGQPYEVLPQHEVLFNIIHKNPKDFRKYFKEYKNIIVANIQDNLNNQDSKVKEIRDKYARGQVIYEVVAKNQQSFVSEFQEQAKTINTLLCNEEIKRLQAKQNKFRNQKIEAELSKNHQIMLNVPKDFMVVADRDDFIWMLRPPGGKHIELEKGLMIYHYPYEKDSTFTAEFLMAKRDSVLKANVPGGPEGSYMTTQYLLPPVYQEIDFKQNFASQIRGLWRVEGDFMGGPYVSLTQLDEKRNRIVTIEGYVYAPHDSKREYIRSMEAVIKSIHFEQ